MGPRRHDRFPNPYRIAQVATTCQEVRHHRGEFAVVRVDGDAFARVLQQLGFAVGCRLGIGGLGLCKSDGEPNGVY